jgi:hypothetical protein
MAVLVVSDFTQETCTSPGLGTITLLGAVVGNRTLTVGIGSGTFTVMYTIKDAIGNNWETNYGTFTSSTNTLTRNATPFASSNAGALVDFASGTQNVFPSLSAKQAVYLDTNRDLTLTGASTLRGSYGGGGVNTNFAAGDGALASNSLGNYMVAIGKEAGGSITTKIAVGSYASGTLLGGTGYTNGTYTGVALTYLSGPTALTYPTANITVAGGIVTACVLVSSGSGFSSQSTIVSFTCASIGAGSGFAYTYGANTSYYTTVSKQISIGYQAGKSVLKAEYGIAIGYQAGLSYSADGSIAIGYQALFTSNSPQSGVNFASIAIGTVALKSATGSSYGNIAIGGNSLSSLTTSAGNVGIGFSCLSSLSTGGHNISLGLSSGGATTGGYNITLGYQAGSSIAVGSSNVFLGEHSGSGISGGSGNINIGKEVQWTSNTSSYNTIIGYQAGKYSTGSHNSFFGSFAGLSSTGTLNSFFGQYAGNGNTTGSYNVGLGANSFSAACTASFNTGLGYYALKNVTSGGGNNVLGAYSAGGLYAPIFDITTQINYLCLGTTATTNAYVQVAWTVVSDARDKTNFAPVPLGLAFVNKLKPTAYQFTENRESNVAVGDVRYGFLAQDILELEGENSVIIDKSDLEKLRYNESSLIPALVNAINELTLRLEILEGKNNV